MWYTKLNIILPNRHNKLNKLLLVGITVQKTMGYEKKRFVISAISRVDRGGDTPNSVEIIQPK